MSNLPNGWSETDIASLVDQDGLFSDGDWIESKDQDLHGSVRLLQLADIGDGKFLDKSHRYVNEEKFELLNCEEVLAGDVLIARMPDPLGRACLMPQLPQKCITVVDVAILRPGNNSVKTHWLMYFVNSPDTRQTMELLSSGSTRKRISRSNLGQIIIPVPPLTEQKRIADKLDSLLVRVESCEAHLTRVQQILKRFRKSVLAAATSGRLTEEWRETNLGEWKSSTLGSVISDLHYGTSKKSIYGLKNGTPVLRIPNISDRRIDATDLKFSHFDEKEIETLALKTGDLLFIRSNGSVELVGKVAIVAPEFEGFLYAGYLIRLRFDKTIVNPHYIALYLSSPASRNHIELTARSTSGVNNINSDEVKGIPLELPPLAEQHEIVRRVEVLLGLAERLEVRWQAALKRVGQLTPAMLAKAFKGELVDQDPNDEPAIELLNRIKQAKENAPKETKKPRRRTDMTAEKAEKDDTRPGVIQALQISGKELSAQQLFQLAGYPSNAKPELVEEFFVEVRDALNSEHIEKKRQNDTDWFSLLRQ